MLKTLSVSTNGMISIAKAITTDDSTGIVIAGESATVINLMTSIEFTSPIIRDPESPINILAGW